jgi:transcriptional regulator with XRE-family HTH domain
MKPFPVADERGGLKQRVGEAIRRARLSRGLTQSALADLVGARDATISDIERGVNMPDVGTLWSIADRLALTVDDLIGRNPPEGATVPGLIAPFMLDADAGTESLGLAVGMLQKSLEMTIAELGRVRDRTARLENARLGSSSPRNKGA